MMSRMSTSVAALGLLVGSACQDPTQIRVEVRTDGITCSELNSTQLRSGSLAEPPSDVVDTTRCTPRDDGGVVGDVVYAPSGSKDQTFSLEVYLGLGNTSAESCRLDCEDNQNCIRASRRLSFVPQQQLYMPIVADPDCLGRCCDDGRTCIAGACVSDEIPGCPEGEPSCAPPEGGGGGGGGGRLVPMNEGFELLDMVDLGTGDAMVPVLVGNFGPSGDRGGVVIAKLTEQGSGRFVCSSDTGVLAFRSAAAQGGELVVLGQASGTVSCGVVGTEPVTLTLSGSRGLFTFALSSTAELSGGSLHELASWTAGTVDEAYLAALTGQQLVLATYHDGGSIEVNGGPVLSGQRVDVIVTEGAPSFSVIDSWGFVVGASPDQMALVANGGGQAGLALEVTADVQFEPLGIPGVTTVDPVNRTVLLLQGNFGDASDLELVQLVGDMGTSVSLEQLGIAGMAEPNVGTVTLGVRHDAPLKVGNSMVGNTSSGQCTLVTSELTGPGVALLLSRLACSVRVGRSRKGEPDDLVAFRGADLTWGFSFLPTPPISWAVDAEPRQMITNDTDEYWIAGTMQEDQAPPNDGSSPACSRMPQPFVEIAPEGRNTFVACFQKNF